MKPTDQYRLLPKSSVNRALNTLGDRWSHLILQEAFLGATRYEDFRARLGIARSTLSNRLQSLIANDIMEQRPFREGMVRMDYHLTERGRDLLPSLLMSWAWGVRWGLTGPTMPLSLTHTGCGKAMLPEMICGHCKEPVTLNSCRYEDGPGAGFEQVAVQRMHRRRNSAGDSPATIAATMEPADLIADRWTGLVIGTQYFGVHRFDDIQARIGIATNILTDRLRTLVANGIFERRLYEIQPPRYEYFMTKKGMDLYPHALSLLHWADRWLAEPEGPPVIIRHKPCGQPVLPQVVCGHCKDVLSSDNLTVRPARRAKED
ncbi:winged helix-turn-helix transcriptional regulator [Govanella unica]|uniref:Helix-turn-helix transcriptional regulator n=1 Tax=Govanella unica TaxID=2975056 RepID=A0A9X3Z6V5_9PROT|nr:helix-turn-helix domain-containing protein [Govania unica]MDA5193516.1 helix-turn-helix transcriptional regulator [Govania unica]